MNFRSVYGKLDNGDEVRIWEQTACIVRLKFGECEKRLAAFLSSKPAWESNVMEYGEEQENFLAADGMALQWQTQSAPDILTTAITLTTSNSTPTTSTGQGQTMTTPALHFERPWKDETEDFNMKKVIATLRPAGKAVAPLPRPFTWFPDAVPVDAIFPPGVPMTAKEINVSRSDAQAHDLPKPSPPPFPSRKE